MRKADTRRAQKATGPGPEGGGRARGQKINHKCLFELLRSTPVSLTIAFIITRAQNKDVDKHLYLLRGFCVDLRPKINLSRKNYEAPERARMGQHKENVIFWGYSRTGGGVWKGGAMRGTERNRN